MIPTGQAKQGTKAKRDEHHSQEARAPRAGGRQVHELDMIYSHFSLLVAVS